MLEGSNCIILDLETAKSAEDCRHCGLDNSTCVRGYPHPEKTHVFEKIGWDDKTMLPLSVGCYFDYQDGCFHWFDVHTVGAVIETLLVRNALLVTFNGLGFDCPLMAAVADVGREQEQH